ncbi:MAG: hypothetical protein ABSG43_17070 [Solirubrobacteraceae bacterium]
MSGGSIDPAFAVEQLRQADQRWAAALRAHEGFATRLRELADAAEQEGGAFRLLHLAGAGWQARKGASSLRLSSELEASSDRPGPPDLWDQFDQAAKTLGQALEDVSVTAIARAFERIGDLAHEIADAIETPDGIKQPGGATKRRTG